MLIDILGEWNLELKSERVVEGNGKINGKRSQKEGTISLFSFISKESFLGQEVKELLLS